MDQGSRIASIEAVPDGGTFLFTVRRTDGTQREAILVRTNGSVAAWLNYCRHYTHIRLDKGSGALIRDGELVCTNHGAMFEIDSGRCTHGPCEGAYLESIDVTVEDDAVYLVDDAFEFSHAGPIPRDVDDLSSTSNLEF